MSYLKAKEFFSDKSNPQLANLNNGLLQLTKQLIRTYLH